MSNALATIPQKDLSAKIEAVLMKGDLAGLSDQERVSYHNAVCESVGLNPLTSPFAYIKLNNKLVLYAKRDATDQLRKVHNVSVTITSREKFDDIYVVTAKAKDAHGREDESTGAVNLKGLSGEALANALMKAETKAKRRVTLSICGLGLLDETEAEPLAEKPVSAQAERAREIADKIRNFAPQSRKDAFKDPEDFGDYVVPAGGFKDKKLRDIAVADLKHYVSGVSSSVASGKITLKPDQEKVIETIESYLNQTTVRTAGIDESEDF